MKRRTHAARNEPRLNVTPFIDVLLVLLIIFMVATSKPPRALDAAEAGGAGPARLVSGTIALGVSADGFVIDGLPVSDAQLRIDLGAAVAAGSTTVIVEATDDAAYADVVEALSAAETAGAERVGLRGSRALE